LIIATALSLDTSRDAELLDRINGLIPHAERRQRRECIFPQPTDHPQLPRPRGLVAIRALAARVDSPINRKELDSMSIRLLALLMTLAATMASLDARAAVGRTPGKFAVSPVGSAQYTIPIWAPPGPRGMQPQIALTYDSNVSIGPLGVGWSLAGLGQVSRCNRTVAQDGTPAPVALVVSDGYCINGNRLRLTAGTYGATGSTYQTEIADFSNITANGTAGNGPAYFTVQGRNGLTYYYGYSSRSHGLNSQVLAAGTTTANAWLLSEVVDRAGNTWVVDYTTNPNAVPATQLTGSAVPQRISWTPAAYQASTYVYTMNFTYTTNVPQSSISKYISGTVATNPVLLSAITIEVNGTAVKNYALEYQASTTTGRETLIKVTECADTTTTNCLAPTNITYQSGGLGVSTNSTTIAQGSRYTRYDLNGDGIPDIIYWNGTEWYVEFGSAGGYGAAVATGVTPANAIILIGNLTGGSEDGFLVPNGDGTWWYYLWNTSSGKFAGSSTGASYDSTARNFQLADVNGDGLPDLLALDVPPDTKGTGGDPPMTTATLNLTLNASTAGVVKFGATTQPFSLDVYAAQLQTPDMQYDKLRRYDFNGDGRDDLVLMAYYGTPPNLTLITYELISTGSGFTATAISSLSTNSFPPVYFTNWNDDACTDFIAANALYISPCNGSVLTAQTFGSVIGAMDWDGDGRTDLLVESGTTIGVYLSTGATAGAPLSTSIPYSPNCQYVTLDVNGDGLDDLGCWNTSSGALTYYLHNGAGQPPDRMSSVTDGYGNSVSPSYASIALGNYTEYPSDPTAPVPAYPDARYYGSLYVVSQAVFSDPSSPSATYTQSFEYYDAWRNLQGRGFEGFWCVRTNDSRYAALTPALNHYEYYEQGFPWTGMKYQDIVNASPVSGASFYPSQTVGTPNTLAQATLSSSAGQQRYFPYFSGYTRYQTEVGGTENDKAITTAATADTYDGYGNLTERSTTVTDTDPGSPYTGKSWTTTTINSMDIDANSTNQAADSGAWCLTMLDQTQVAYSSTVSGSTAVTRTKKFTPDTPAACRSKGAVTEPTANAGVYAVTEALTFDNFGNVATDTVTGAKMPNSPASRATTLNWGATGQFLTSLTVPTGTLAAPTTTATTSWTYTSNQSLGFGEPDSQTDANNLKTSWAYDAFGRKQSETRPDKTSTAWAFTNCASHCAWSNSVYELTQTAYQTDGKTPIRIDTSAYDSVDRVTQTISPTISASGTATATVQTLYNSFGSVAQRSLPFTGGTIYQQAFQYDALKRLTAVTRPISAAISTPQSTTYAYAGRTVTITDPKLNKKTMVTDVNGWLRKTSDALGYTVTQAYDAAGSLIGVTDSLGNSLLSGVQYQYGIKPFRVAATDADLGAWIYGYDSVGEIIDWRDAKSQNFSMSYDALSRPVSRTEPDLYTQWTYGSSPSADNVGQLIQECSATGSPTPTTCGASPQYSETRTYDTTGRLSTRAIAENGNPGNDPGGVFLFTTAYSATTGLPSQLTYPISTAKTALAITYAYQNGLLRSVTDATDATGTCGSTCTLWTANAMNGFGEITQETLGNGVVTTRSFDAVTSWISKVTAGVGVGSATILNQSYAEDLNGNVTQRQNNNPQGSSSTGLTENFFYDADNRLTCATLTSACTTPTFIYDGGAAGPGNITTQAGVGTYTYPTPGSARPHAVASIAGTVNGISNPGFVYDANGNMTNRASASQNVTWSSYNYPTVISASDVTGTEEVQLFYGPDRQRWQQIYTGPSSTERTYYIGGLMDLVFVGNTTDYRHYIYAGNEPIAVYSRTAAGGVTMSYMLEDHQSGVSAIASAAGGVDVEESFSAFGARRNPATWVGAPSAGDLTTIAGLSRQGFTFQTWLGQSMGLNHMNGRVQDAIIGRFLSPDPHVPDPSNAQNYNRYSYVNNNPLSFTDPTGFSRVGPCDVYCPSDIQRVPSGGIGTIGDGIFGTAGNEFDDVFANFPDLGQLTASLNALSASINSVLDAGFDKLLASAAANNQIQQDVQQSFAAQSQCVGSPCANYGATSGSSSGGGILAFVAPAVGVVNDVLIALGQVAIGVGGVLWPMPGGDGDPNTDSNSAYVFHFATDAKMSAIQGAGQISPNPALGVTWVTPTPYPTAALAQSQLALPYTPAGFYAIPVQNLQTPLSWSTVQPNFGQPGGGVEGTTPLSIQIAGAYWVPFPH
jgi:RHS repeat-associated protein